jgi:outer membrane protein assembly factor BamE (lipoprotein component of BamABCDE complex)
MVGDHVRNACIGLALLVGGCASSGNASLETANNASVSQQIVRGKTTKAEISAAYGKPMYTTIDPSGQEQWVYALGENTNSSAIDFVPIVGQFSTAVKGTAIRNRTLTVYFDKSNRVTNFTFSDMNLQMGGVR